MLTSNRCVLQTAKMVILLLGLSIKLSPLFHPYRGKRILSQEGNCILTYCSACCSIDTIPHGTGLEAARISY